MNKQPYVTLNNGIQMPQFGLGVFKSRSGEETKNAVSWALQAGYRAIDTASYYDNEESVGEGLRASGVSRDSIFVTTKVWNSQQGYENTLNAFEESLEKLGLEYLDLYLMHWPIVTTYRETWKAMEQLYQKKRVRAIGVSNFEPHHLKDLASDAEIAPTVNQVELHPYLQQKEVRDYCTSKNIFVTAWSPIARGKVIDDPVIQEIARSHGRSPVQITLRWELQLGIITIPKSVKQERIVQNAEIFDFALSDAEMERIAGLDNGPAGRIGPHPDNIMTLDLPDKYTG